MKQLMKDILRSSNLKKKQRIILTVNNKKVMTKVVLLGVTYYEVNLGGVSYMAFNPQELVVRMAQANLSLN
jgi:hypothetical protein